jgi:tetratricopeptide (TPR) repeat protein
MTSGANDRPLAAAIPPATSHTNDRSGKAADILPPTSTTTIPVGAFIGLVSLPNVDVVLATVVSVVILGFLIALAFAFYREVRNDTVFLESIEVPAELDALGFHPSVVAAHLLDEAVAIQQRGSGWRRRRRLENVAAVADIQAPGGYLSIRNIVKSVRAMLGRPATRISGDITRNGDGYLLRLRVGGRVIEAVGGPHAAAHDVESLIHNGAQDLLQAVDPFALASYFFNGPEAGTAAPNTMRLVHVVLRNDHVEDRAWAHSLWASVLLGQGREQEAMEKYRAALDVDQRVGSQHALENLAKALVRNGKETEAVRLVDSVAARRPVHLENLVAAAVAYGRLGRWTRALAMAEGALRHYHHHVLAHQIHGFALAGLHRYDESIDALRHSRDLDRANSTTEFLLAWTLTRAGRNDEAMRVASEAVARIPGGHHQQTAMGFALLALGKPGDACASFERADKSWPMFEVCKLGWGEALLALDDVTSALAKFEEAIALNPHLGEAWRGCGEALARQQRHQDALAKFERALQEDANDPDTCRAWAAALEAVGRGDEARGKREQAAAIARRNGTFGSSPRYRKSASVA